MRKVLSAWMLGALALAAGVSAGVASAAPAPTVSSSANATLGPILVSAAGRTLYHPSFERRGAVACTHACAVRWPPLLVSRHTRPVAGHGVSAGLLGTLVRPDGKLQVAYRGLALYRYAGDTQAGQARGEGVGGSWHALTPAGAPVPKPAASSSPGPATAMSGSGTTTVTSTGSVNPAMWCAANPSSCVNGVPVNGSR